MKFVLDTDIKKKQMIFSVEAVSFITDPKNSWNSPTLYMEMKGDASSMRAIWAHLVKHRDDEKTNIKLHTNMDEISLSVTKGTKFVSQTHDGHMFIYTNEFGETSRKYFIGGDNETPPEMFLDSFRINVPHIPILPEWINPLWKTGLEKQGIVPMRVFSNNQFNCWKIKDKFSWEDLIKEEVHKWLN